MYPYSSKREDGIDCGGDAFRHEQSNKKTDHAFPQPQLWPNMPMEPLYGHKNDNYDFPKQPPLSQPPGGFDGHKKPHPVHTNLDSKLLDLIVMSMQNELDDSEYYKRLTAKTPDDADKDIVYNVYLDEVKHYKLLSEIYFMLSQKQPPKLKSQRPHFEKRLAQDFYDSTVDETEDVKNLRRLLFAFTNDKIKQIIYEIITDEQRHASVFSMLYSKYK